MLGVHSMSSLHVMFAFIMSWNGVGIVVIVSAWWFFVAFCSFCCFVAFCSVGGGSVVFIVMLYVLVLVIPVIGVVHVIPAWYVLSVVVIILV